MGNQYKIEYREKGSLGKQVLTGEAKDSILIVKNAYHRCRVYVNEEIYNTISGRTEYIFGFKNSETNGMIHFIGGETGLVGRLIMRLVYGEAKDFYESVFNSVQSEYQLEERTIDIGLNGAKKKN